jgi:hypothetical protein
MKKRWQIIKCKKLIYHKSKKMAYYYYSLTVWHASRILSSAFFHVLFVQFIYGINFLMSFTIEMIEDNKMLAFPLAWLTLEFYYRWLRKVLLSLTSCWQRHVITFSAALLPRVSRWRTLVLWVHWARPELPHPSRQYSSAKPLRLQYPHPSHPSHQWIPVSLEAWVIVGPSREPNNILFISFSLGIKEKV